MPQRNDEDRVRANEPLPVEKPGIASQSPAESSERADAIDAETAGDGVAFFEGGDGREGARADVEREG